MQLRLLFTVLADYIMSLLKRDETEQELLPYCRTTSGTFSRTIACIHRAPLAAVASTHT